jgi:RNA polymerase sigma-70 factor (ECF subfamily)
MPMLRAIEKDGPKHSAQLLELVSKELHAIAQAYLRHERKEHTLQPTALVHEAYLRLVDSTAIRGGDRGRFMSIAARAMRRVLVDYARQRKAGRRGDNNWQRVTLHPDLVSARTSDVDLLELNEMLERLSALDERASRVVELRFFAGFSLSEAAEALGVSERTVDNDWHMARAWLARELSASLPS